MVRSAESPRWTLPELLGDGGGQWVGKRGVHGDEEGQTRRTDEALRKFAFEGEERWGWEEGPREVCLIKKEGTSAYSKADVERERLRFKREGGILMDSCP